MATNQRLGANGDIALGDTVPITLTIRKRNAVTGNLEAYEPTVTAATALFKAAETDADADALIELTLGAGVEVSTSTATLTITPTMQAALTATQTLYWSCKIEEDDGTETTIASGTLTLTRRAARDEL